LTVDSQQSTVSKQPKPIPLSTVSCRLSTKKRLEGIEHENARDRRDREDLGRVWTWELPEKALVMTTSIEERRRLPGTPPRRFLRVPAVYVQQDR